MIELNYKVFVRFLLFCNIEMMYCEEFVALCNENFNISCFVEGKNWQKEE